MTGRQTLQLLSGLMRDSGRVRTVFMPGRFVTLIRSVIASARFTIHGREEIGHDQRQVEPRAPVSRVIRKIMEDSCHD